MSRRIETNNIFSHNPKFQSVLYLIGYGACATPQRYVGLNYALFGCECDKIYIFYFSRSREKCNTRY